MRVLGVALLATTGAVTAQEVAEPLARTLEPVVVTATRAERAQLDVPASVSVLTRSEIRDTQLRVNLSEALPRVPGVVANNRENYAQDLQISIRGFGARSTFGVRGIRLYLDGVPATQPDGQGQVSNFPLNAAERIEVLRGPFSALYGNASGGVIAMTTRLLPEPFTPALSLAGGSFGTWRAAVSANGGSDPFAYALDASAFSTRGYREHSAATRQVLNLSGAWLDSPLGQLRVTYNGLAMPDAQDPLGLTREQWEREPAAASPLALLFDTRKTTRQNQVSVQLARPLGDGWSFGAVGWLGERSVQQFQAIPASTQANPLSPGGVIAFSRPYGGVDARVQWTRDALTLTAGLDWQRLDEDRQGYENFLLVAGTPVFGLAGRLRRDESNRVESTDPYLQLEWAWAQHWRLHAGLRASRVSFDSQDRYVAGVNGDDSGSVAYQAWTPSAGVTWRPTPNASVYASAGRGFETPTLNELAYRPGGAAGLNLGLDSATSDNFELGAKWVALPGLQVSAALFRVATRDEIVVLSNFQGRSAFGNAGTTLRQGAELAFDWRPAPEVSLSFAGTALNARFTSPFLTCGPPPCVRPSVPVADGNRLPGVPSYTAFAMARWTPGWADWRLEWRAQSQMFVDDRNSAAAPGYGVLNLAVARTLTLGGVQVRAFLRLNNLADKGYVGAVIVNEANGRHYEPAPGRNVLIGLDLTP
ncbi:MAG TPA: TonB-dependent receptor [Burkholderiaceae bacterium]|nr:TonB-dependent receptor [Burkholderiaceae bacterium]